MKSKKNWKYYLKKTANGTISLFLIVLLTPFLTVAALLLEAQHYNSSVALLDEAMASSSVSVLADYDSYLKDRWGLVAAGQKKDLNDSFSTYLESNVKIVGNTLQVNGTAVTGCYALTEKDVLANQILEYSKYNITSNAVKDAVEGVLNLFDISDKLSGLEDVGKLLDFAKDGADTAESMLDVIDASDELKKSANELKKKIEACEKKYGDGNGCFESRMNKLTEKLKEDRPSDAKEAEKYDKEVNSRRNDYENAKNAYSNAIGDLVSEMKTYESAMEKLSKALDSVESSAKSMGSAVVDEVFDEASEKYDEAKKKVDDYKGDKNSDEYKKLVKDKDAAEVEKQNAEIEKKGVKAADKGVSELEDAYKEAVSGYSKEVMDAKIGELESLKTSLPGKNSIGKDDIADGYQIGSVVYASADDIVKLIAEMEAKKNDASLSGFVKGMVAAYNSLMSFSTIYEPSLCALVDSAKLERTTATEAIDGVAQALKGAKKFKDADSLRKYWEAIKDVCEGVATAITKTQQFITETVASIPSNVGTLLTTDRLWYVTYCYYMLTCRTDFNRVSQKTGSPAMVALGTSPDLPEPAIMSSNAFGGTDSLLAVLSTFTNLYNGTTEPAFYGAEAEYMLLGSNSELINQIYAFILTYMVRFLIDIPAVAFNSEVAEIADAAGAATFGIGTVIVYALELFLEPLVDTLILVNRGTVPLYETTIFLTPSGAPKLFGKLVQAVKLTDTQKKEMQNNLKKAYKKDVSDKVDLSKETADKGTTSGGGFDFTKLIPEIDYRQQCMILTILTVSNDELLKRLGNIIQLETAYHYKDDCTFELSKSYTFLETSADVKIGQIAPSLTDQSIFEVNRTLYRGY
ncbi:MAG: hypothetical protein IJ642_09900 [Oscillospiraceae bacterium]|nr:hypothetical protein [Oscillospiraceae bacterium]